MLFNDVLAIYPEPRVPNRIKEIHSKGWVAVVILFCFTGFGQWCEGEHTHGIIAFIVAFFIWYMIQDDCANMSPCCLMWLGYFCLLQSVFEGIYIMNNQRGMIFADSHFKHYLIHKRALSCRRLIAYLLCAVMSCLSYSQYHDDDDDSDVEALFGPDPRAHVGFGSFATAVSVARERAARRESPQGPKLFSGFSQKLGDTESSPGSPPPATPPAAAGGAAGLLASAGACSSQDRRKEEEAGSSGSSNLPKLTPAQMMAMIERLQSEKDEAVKMIATLQKEEAEASANDAALPQVPPEAPLPEAAEAVPEVHALKA